MQIYVTSDSSDNVFSVDVGAETDLAVLKVLCESECGIASDEMVLVHEGRPLTGDEKQMAHFGLKDGDMVMVSKRVRMRQPPAQPSQAGSSSRSFSLDDDPEVVRQMFLNNPDQLVMLRQANPRLASALDAGDAAAFARILKEQLRVRQEEERRRIRMLTADPFDPETQALIAEEIRQKNVDANMEQALEFNPESFGVVVMLYIDCTVNGHHVKAFVDSGAQTTLMSAECAERCGIRRLIDSRWGGIAKGVGTQRITGRVHMAQIQIAGCFLASSFSILEEQPMDMLLGLDMLRRHQCIIDLKRNVLVIGTTGKETRFLAESELPACARLSGSGSDADKELAKALAESATEAAKVSAVLPTDKFNEDQVNKVVATTSCSRDEAMNALRAAEGNPDVAMLSILARGLAAPGPSPKK